MLALSKFLQRNEILELNLVSKQFYELFIPLVMRNRQLYPTINPETHLFAKNGKIFGINLSTYSKFREIDFEEDEWRHDNHYMIVDKKVSKVEIIFDTDELKAIPDEKIKLQEGEELLM